MTPATYILASLRHHRRMHVALALGVAVATAVLTGALVVGDSVRGSLRGLTLERLGRIDAALVADHFFRAALADDVRGEPAMLLPGTIEAGQGSSTRRATRAAIVGVRPSFWQLGANGPQAPLAADSVAITEPLARELEVKPGDMVLVRAAASGALPADSPLGDKNDTSRARRLRVAEVLPVQGLARFALQPSQQLARNVFVPLETLQALVNEPGRANAILVAGAVDRTAFKPQLADYGLRLEEVATPTKYTSLSAERLVLSDAVVSAVGRAFEAGEVQPVVTYLANALVAGDGAHEKRIPYSTIAGIDSIAGAGPLLDEQGSPITLDDGEIALNRWAADDLGVHVGDSIEVLYYEPESTHGVLKQPAPLEFRLAAIAELQQAGEPTPAADPRLTPELKGVTDQDSIADWDLPFELVEKIRPHDEDYWDKYRTTPKAFVSRATAAGLWASRWGTTSLLRFPGKSAHDVAERLERVVTPEDVGMTFVPVKELGLAAARGTTPFDALFLGFSLFLIAAAVMLIALLFKLGIEQRAGELGTLGAIGLRTRRIARMVTVEGLLAAILGATLGVALGVGYAWLMIAGLRTWWIAAVGTPFMTLHVTRTSLLLGWLAGVVVSWLAIRWSIGRLARQPAGRLLAGEIETAAAEDRAISSSWPRLREALVAAVLGLAILGYLLAGEARAGLFFGSGAVALGLLLGEVRYQLRRLGRAAPRTRAMSLRRVAALNVARHPGRSTLTIGLVAVATFLIAAISAFRLAPSAEGTGGFLLTATSDQPIHFDLSTTDGRQELGFSDQHERLLADWNIRELRVVGGEDASCLNLYRPTQPRLLGVPRGALNESKFGWAATLPAARQSPTTSPWQSLDLPRGDDDAGRPIVPVVLDQNTATYSLHLRGLGARLVIRDAAQRPVTLEVVGLLKNSVLQGNLLVSEANLLRLFPEVGGYRMFLLRPRGELPTDESASRAQAAAVVQALESTLAAEGLDVVRADDQLAGFLAVQNTYLSTFQSLGALGLLLGTIGLAVVQLRNVLERRGEFALMRASGFRGRRLVELVMIENGLLLFGGLLSGLLAATVALAPQWTAQGASVPWLTLGAMLATIACAGLLAGWLATRSAVAAPLVATLRGE